MRSDVDSVSTYSVKKAPMTGANGGTISEIGCAVYSHGNIFRERSLQHADSCLRFRSTA
jgi:hypothetical protein